MLWVMIVILFFYCVVQSVILTVSSHIDRAVFCLRAEYVDSVCQLHAYSAPHCPHPSLFLFPNHYYKNIIIKVMKWTTLAVLYTPFSIIVYHFSGDVWCSSSGWELVWLGEGGEEVEGVCEWDAQADRRMQSSVWDGATGASGGARECTWCLRESCRWKGCLFTKSIKLLQPLLEV